MRHRRVIISAVLLFAAALAFAFCRDAGGTVEVVVSMARRFIFGALMGTGFWAASHALQRSMGQSFRPALPPGPPAPPVPTFMAPPQTGPGKYRVRGVDQDTHFQTTEVVYADSPSNAQFKVELKGVDVAAVERAG